MSKDDGFAVADVSTSKFSDPKFRALWRLCAPDEGAMAKAVMLYEAVQLASWQHGERLTAEDAAPVWIAETVAPIEALSVVGLLDRTHRIPAKAWKTWFGAASQRRQTLRDRWQRANSKRENSADTSPLPRGDSAVTASPVPSVRSAPYVPFTPSVPPPAAAVPEKKHGSKNLDEERADLLLRLRDEDLKPDIVNAIYARIAQIDNTPRPN